MSHPRPASRLCRIVRLEHRTEPVLGRGLFAARMGYALFLWLAVTVVSLSIGMAGYAYFEGMDVTNSFVNAAMILSGMGEFDQLTTPHSKIFAGLYALMSGLVILVATTFIIAPVFHRVLHHFHVERGRDARD